MNTDNTALPAKLALVTGAGQGIGAATAHRLLREGFRVITLDKTATGHTDDAIIDCEFDLEQTSEIGPLVERLVAAHGPITALVNNAGVWNGGPITELSDATWQRVLAVNLTAPFALIRAIAPVMAEAGGGSIVNIASRNAFRSSVNNAAYDASKAGVVALTRTAAGELAKDNIRVNAVCPGVISTPGDASAEEPLFKAAYTKQIPMDRYGSPDEIAGVIAFLLSNDSTFITGQSIIVDGGQIACQDNQRYMEIPNLKVEG